MKHTFFSIRAFLVLTAVFMLNACYSPRGAAGDVPGQGRQANTVQRSDLLDNPNISIADMLRRVPGVLVRGDNSIQIQGATSIYFSTEPLFVVDGTPVGAGYSTVAGLNPMDVDRISVLKGSDASIYGSRGANGVILIKTKDGTRN